MPMRLFIKLIWPTGPSPRDFPFLSGIRICRFFIGLSFAIFALHLVYKHHNVLPNKLRDHRLIRRFLWYSLWYRVLIWDSLFFCVHVCHILYIWLKDIWQYNDRYCKRKNSKLEKIINFMIHIFLFSFFILQRFRKLKIMGPNFLLLLNYSKFHK